VSSNDVDIERVGGDIERPGIDIKRVGGDIERVGVDLRGRDLEIATLGVDVGQGRVDFRPGPCRREAHAMSRSGRLNSMSRGLTSTSRTLRVDFIRVDVERWRRRPRSGEQWLRAPCRLRRGRVEAVHSDAMDDNAPTTDGEGRLLGQPAALPDAAERKRPAL